MAVASNKKQDPWATQVGSMWHMTATFAAKAVEKVPVVDNSRILDIAAGTGTASILLAKKATMVADAQIVASDLSPGMLQELRRLAEEASVSNIIKTIEENAMALSASDARFDATVSVFGIPLVPDPAQAAAEMARVLKPEGTAVIMWWEQVPTIPMMRELIVAFGGNPSEAEIFESRFAVYDSGEKIQALMEVAGLTVTNVEHVTLPFDLAWVAREDPQALFANPVIGKYIANMPQDRARIVLMKLCDDHASDWSHATASIVTAVKNKS